MLLTILLGQGSAGPQNYVLIADPGAFSLTGTSAATSAARSLTLDPASYAYTAADATTRLARSLTALPGALSLTGNASTTIADRRISLDPTSYTLTGLATTTRVSRSINAEPASYSVSGNAATTAYSRRLTLSADAATLVCTGADAALTHVRKLDLSADVGAVSLTGADAMLVYAPNSDTMLVAESGSFTYSGSIATLLRTYRMTAEPTSFGWAGGSATTTAERYLAASTGALSLTGATAALSYASPKRVMVANPGSFDALGTDATLAAGRVMVALPPNAGDFIDPDYIDAGYSEQLGYSLSDTYIDDNYTTPDYFGSPDARLVANRALNLNAGSIVLTGFPATLDKTGAATTPEIVAAIVAALMSRASKANIVEVNNVLITGAGALGNPWGPTTGSYGYGYTPPTNTQEIVEALLTALDDVSIPVDIKQVNAVAVTGAGQPGAPWGPA